ncbi:MAG: hypothetical protein JJU33_08675 [Phycisphaerales bacterium]|nr:hypothetical protein [Phycisphaerales bacterium]
MRWARPSWGFGRGRGAQYRKMHSEWLTMASRGELRAPRIPIREVSRGGFSGFLSRPGGRVLLEWWWAATLDSVEDLPRRRR